MNITEKIIAEHACKETVQADEIVTVKIDGVLANDVSGPIAIKELYNMGFNSVFDKERVYFVNDHFAPNCNINAAQQSRAVRLFVEEQGIEYFFDTGRMGIEHGLLPEQGLVQPGNIIVGGDSHTCTYGALGAFSTGMGSTDIGVAMGTGEIWLKVPAAIKAEFTGKTRKYVTGKDLILFLIGQIGVSGALYKTLEFTGKAIENLTMADRFTMCNMAIEAGAKNGIVAPDDKTLRYVEEHNLHDRTFSLKYTDGDDDYATMYTWDVSDLKPLLACPHSPENVKGADELKNINVDQVVIGSCTNGRYEDLVAAADIFRGNRVSKHVRAILIPATQEVYLRAIQAGLIETFIEAGVAVSTPTCGPCFGGHMGILAEDECAVSTTNRNFIGRMGHKTSSVYLANPYVAAACAVAGEIVNPEEVRK